MPVEHTSSASPTHKHHPHMWCISRVVVRVCGFLAHLLEQQRQLARPVPRPPFELPEDRKSTSIHHHFVLCHTCRSLIEKERERSCQSNRPVSGQAYGPGLMHMDLFRGSAGGGDCGVWLLAERGHRSRPEVSRALQCAKKQNENETRMRHG